MLRKIKCWFGFHKKRYMRLSIVGPDQWCCLYCDVWDYDEI